MFCKVLLCVISPLSFEMWKYASILLIETHNRALFTTPFSSYNTNPDTGYRMLVDGALFLQTASAVWLSVPPLWWRNVCFQLKGTHAFCDFLLFIYCYDNNNLTCIAKTQLKPLYKTMMSHIYDKHGQLVSGIKLMPHIRINLYMIDFTAFANAGFLRRMSIISCAEVSGVAWLKLC